MSFDTTQVNGQAELKETLRTDELLLNMGPQHPSTHGVLRVVVTTDGEIVKDARPEIGYLHRCFEKHAENSEYIAVSPYVDRLDYLASMNNSMGYAIAVESLLGIEVPRRAEFIRVIISELQRIASHLMSYGTYGLDMGAFTAFMYGFRDREMILDIFEKISGARLLYNYMWIGGTYRDITPEIIKQIKDFLIYFKPKVEEYNNLVTYNKIFLERTRNIGVIDLKMCHSYGLTGVMLRGAGLKWDLRKDHPYSIYKEVEFDVPVGTGQMGTLGDCWDRHIVRMNEMIQSIRIIEQLIDGIPEGPHRAKVGKVIKPPAGEVYSRTECPRGELGFYLISDGSGKPYRVRCKSPCFMNISTLNELSQGVMVADLIATIGSLDIVLGEVDR
ncbi:MAG: NADH-quinone oxidoreductase subunit D [Deltaproteobacteria bacterium]|nr:NADH-quinone oxidoreductase subunit D [Deltaproteobacteria bacterium]MBM4316993.1 NADH-quinone oxidoreductase subunit D [Deltaproteobacteria bacterium]